MRAIVVHFDTDCQTGFTRSSDVALYVFRLDDRIAFRVDIQSLGTYNAESVTPFSTNLFTYAAYFSGIR